MELETALQHLAVDGWCVLEDIVPASALGTVRDSILATIEAHGNPDPRRSLGKVSGLINYDQSLAPYLAAPPLLLRRGGSPPRSAAPRPSSSIGSTHRK